MSPVVKDNERERVIRKETKVMGVLAGSSVLCFRRCPGYFKCIVMYARYRFRRYMRWAAKAELLVLLQNWSIMLNGDRWLKG